MFVWDQIGSSYINVLFHLYSLSGEELYSKAGYTQM